MSQTQKDLEKLKAWLATYPAWEERPPDILPKALDEITRQSDVLGNTLVGYRYTFSLFWQKSGQGNGGADAQGLLDFQRWVSAQCSERSAPQFGDVPAFERIRLEKGGLTPLAQAVTYTVTLLADFLKVYEVRDADT